MDFGTNFYYSQRVIYAYHANEHDIDYVNQYPVLVSLYPRDAL